MAHRLLPWSNIFVKSYRIFFSSVFNNLKCYYRRYLSTVTLSSSVLLASNIISKEDDSKLMKFKTLDSSTLSHSQLVKNASSVTVDAVCCLINQATSALIHIDKEYAKSIYTLIRLLDYQADIKGGEEDTLWDLIIQQKAAVADNKAQRDELEIVMSSVAKLASAAAETAFSVGADSLAIMLNEHLLAGGAQVTSHRDVSCKAETDLTDAQVRDIRSSEGDTEDDILD